MGRLAIRRVIYKGEKYSYESPYLNDGLVIMEGVNGHGKSTFMSLIYYCLGGSVQSFNKNDNSGKKHKEICEDKNNYVEMLIEINGEEYELTRYIGSSSIFIVDEKENVIETCVFRQQNDKTITVFSDWILDKLKIEVFDLVQGTKSFKLNFTDLMRLIYHDQTTEVDRIYKDADNSNFMSDSLEIRKAIFEILLGKIYNDYYYTLGQYKIKLKEYEKAIEYYDKAIEIDPTKSNYYMFKADAYKMMNDVADIYCEKYADETELMLQKNNMSEAEREEFLDRFSEESDRTLVAFGIMGGIFGEGIDLKNDRLIGAIVVGTGLPQISNERTILKDYYDAENGCGFDYAFRYPGINKVLQAAGRVIRTTEDTGVILLLDERFWQREYDLLYPREWNDRKPCNIANVGKLVADFWEQI